MDGCIFTTIFIWLEKKTNENDVLTLFFNGRYVENK